MPVIQQSSYGYQNLQSGYYTVAVPSFDANSSVFNIELDASLIIRPGKYVIIKSTSQLANYVGAAVYFVNGESKLSIRAVTPGGIGESITFSGTPYYCVVVEVR